MFCCRNLSRNLCINVTQPEYPSSDVFGVDRLPLTSNRIRNKLFPTSNSQNKETLVDNLHSDTYWCRPNPFGSGYAEVIKGEISR